ncbi:MAG: Asp-tRNA(Asn)/Glu-tRNA(Gln) amidotransferase subunit GatB [Clostridia bacterium]|nr:Asp-tRNA(Asn)/Glu-tRNA(Gln) amidotransferase subunit GatB [Clostridia bacterium]
MDYQTVVGLEIHAELLTNSKIFCSCSTTFGREANTQVCPVCMGMPGSLPTLNKKAVELAVKAGLALNCTISDNLSFDRKNYFYPDLPKAYQISQFNNPLCKDGYIKIDYNGKPKKIGIADIHIEEDAGKLVHAENGQTLIDYNRCGVGLIEIVTKPDINFAEEAKLVFEEIKDILECLKISDCKMQEGSLRCDVNVSVMPLGTQTLGERTEIKNLNSFGAVARAIKNESQRQIEVIKSGQKVIRQTRKWDDLTGKNTLLRNKENSDDYRFFPEPDLPTIKIGKSFIDNIKESIIELPRDKKVRFMKDYLLSEFDAHLISRDLNVSNWFEKAVSYGADVKRISSFIVTDIRRLMKEKKLEKIPFEPEKLVKLVSMINDGVISLTASKQIIEIMFESTDAPEIIAKKNNLIQVSDENELDLIAQVVLNENKEAVDDYKKGKEKAILYLTGQVMKKTRGSANPIVINKLLREKLSN